MGQFEEPTVLATFDRSWGDKKEEMRLERGSYNGKPTYALRLYWQGGDGSWRWASQKPTASGKCWERLNLKARELRELGAALLAAADGDTSDSPPPRRSRRSEPAHFEAGDDDVPF